MNKRISNNMIIIWMLLGLMFGNIFGKCLANYTSVECLRYGYTFGLVNPIVLELGALVTSFGLQIYINVTGVIGMVISIIMYNFYRRRVISL